MDAVEHAEMVEKKLMAFIERRSRQGEVDPDEREELWKASVRRYNARKRAEMRAAWAAFHESQAASLRQTLEDLVSHHQTQAERYRGQPEGAT